MSRIAPVLAALVAAGCLLPATAAAAVAGGDVTPNPNRIAAVAKAYLPKALRAKTTIEIKVSTVNRYWASATVVAKPGFELDSGLFLVLVGTLPKLNGTYTWSVVDDGSASVGCAVAPAAVLRNLFDRGWCGR